MDKRTAPHPSQAWQFKAEPAVLAAKKEGPRKVGGTCYSGNPLRHPYWGVVVFDLSTTQANEPTPLLIGHDRNQRAGFASLDIQAGAIAIKDGTLLDNPHGQAVASESDAGFPWQMSVHIEPASIEELKAGGQATINGQTINGPAVIFRNNRIREVSFTPTGVDNDTDALALSATTFTPTTTQEDSDMNIEELKAKVTELETGLQASQAAAEAEKKRADDAEAALAGLKASTRIEQVKELFAAIGREYSDEAAKPYLGMDETAFAAVSADMKASKPQVPDSLFSAHATAGQSGQESDQGEKLSLDPSKIYAARRISK